MSFSCFKTTSNDLIIIFGFESSKLYFQRTKNYYVWKIKKTINQINLFLHSLFLLHFKIFGLEIVPSIKGTKSVKMSREQETLINNKGRENDL